MNCSSCGAYLSPGAAACPVCGVPTPYNTSGPSQYQPTAAASPYGTPTPPPQGASPYDATYVSSPYSGPAPQQPVPPTSYGYGQPSQNPYGTPANPYAPPQDPYGAPAFPQQQPVYPGAPFQQPQPPKRKSRVGLIIGIIALVLVLACGGIITTVVITAKNAVSTLAPTLTSIASTPTSAPTTPQGTSPSGSPIVPSAAAIITNPKMASAIDSNYTPTKLTTTFTTNQKVYVTYNFNTQGQSGFTRAKWYINGQLDATSIILTVQSDYTAGFFADILGTQGNGAVELYWCTQSDCSDAQLATFTTFTISGTGLHTTGQPSVVIIDMDRRA